MPSLSPKSSVLERMPLGSRIAIIRLRSLGDCVLTTPALHLLKSHRPDLRLGVVVEDRFRAIFEANPDIEAILAPRAAAILQWHPHLALNLHGGTRSMALTACSGGALRAGFGHHRFSFIYSAKIPRAQEILGEERPVHTAEHIASAMFWMGVPQTEIPRARLAANKIPEFVRGGYAVLHPFASAADKTWPASNFLAVAMHLRRTCDLEPVFVAGPDDDVSAFEGFRIWRGAPLGELKSLMAQAQTFIGNDSGPAHIAAAFGVPVVAIFGSSNAVTWAPWKTEARVLKSEKGISGIQVDEAVAAIEALRDVHAHPEPRA